MRKILIADPSGVLLPKLLASPAGKNYSFASVSQGDEVFSAIQQHGAELVVLDLMLPKMHGIELLQRIRSDEKLRKIGVIIISTNMMTQNLHAALVKGVDYFLPRPVDIELLFSLFERFYKGTLHPDNIEQKSTFVEEESFYKPITHDPHSYIKFWGTRGSNPVSGPEYMRFGGNTACLEVRHGKDRIIIDAGTGIRPLGHAIEHNDAKTVHLFLSHTHWDHITGFPFFGPLYNPDREIIIWSPIGFEKPTRELFTEILAYSYFPVRLEDIKAKLQFNDLREGYPVSIGDITIDSHFAYHPGATYCFKIHVAGKKYGYATDNEMFLGYHGHPNAIGKDSPLLKSHKSIIDFFTGCDVLIHEAQYTPQEYQRRVGWGHSSVANAALLCKYAQIKEWIVTHHDPKHSDEDLLRKLQMQKDILAECHIPCHVQSAFDSLTLPI